jgi:hypothetical protein
MCKDVYTGDVLCYVQMANQYHACQEALFYIPIVSMDYPSITGRERDCNVKWPPL